MARRLPARSAAVLMPFFLSMLMTCIVSLVSTVMALGPVPEVLGRWPQAWGLSWAVAFPVMLLVMPVVRRLVALLVEPSARQG